MLHDDGCLHVKGVQGVEGCSLSVNLRGKNLIFKLKLVFK